jgi:hypothetical protein
MRLYKTVVLLLALGTTIYVAAVPVVQGSADWRLAAGGQVRALLTLARDNVIAFAIGLVALYALYVAAAWAEK